jgi:hypothetical protein
MKKIVPLAAVCLLVLGGAVVSSANRVQDPPQEDLNGRVLRLEADLAKAEAALAQQAELLAQTVEYLQGQSKAAKELLGALDEVEAAGFTAGINFRSRELLLASFRSYWGEELTGVPGVKTAPETAPTRQR